MCGIIGVVAQRDVAPILLEGLKRLEYRGYDSAGMAVVQDNLELGRYRALGKVKELEKLQLAAPLLGDTGIAHTRWATHGKPSEYNAHPHVSANEVVVVHNGIIENYQEFFAELEQQGYNFASETDSETVVHLLHARLSQGENFLTAVQRLANQLKGAYALTFMRATEPGRLLALCRGCPLVIGIGVGEHFLASDVLALLPVTRKFIYLEDGDVADIRRDRVDIYDENGRPVTRPVRASQLSHEVADRGPYRHFMQKEMFEQPEAVLATLEGRVTQKTVLEASLQETASTLLDQVKRVRIVACGTSYHAGLVARYWFEQLGIPCQVEVASEIRYRPHIVEPSTLLLTLSQSGETADTLAALRQAKQLNYLATLGICNVPESSLVREADLVLMTRAGPEIGVASTKAFMTQLVALYLLGLMLGRRFGLSAEQEAQAVQDLHRLPQLIKEVLNLNSTVQTLAKIFADKRSALFVGRGIYFPIALEGALKLKEISYIHAEAYPAGELKHGPLALIDEELPVIALAPTDELLDKIKSNLQEIRARGGQLIIFTDRQSQLAQQSLNAELVYLPEMPASLAPFLYTISMQLLAYHVALLKGTDVDQPRNLAKSVTVE